MTKTFLVNVGIDFPPEQRREAGETVTDKELPKTSLDWLVADGHLTPIDTPKPSKTKPEEGS